MEFIRDFAYQSSYGDLFGRYELDAEGDLFAVIARFDSVKGERRPLNYRLAATDLDDNLLREAFESVVRTEAMRIV